jgi:hypothetical protein
MEIFWLVFLCLYLQLGRFFETFCLRTRTLASAKSSVNCANGLFLFLTARGNFEVWLDKAYSQGEAESKANKEGEEASEAEEENEDESEEEV